MDKAERRNAALVRGLSSHAAACELSFLPISLLLHTPGVALTISRMVPSHHLSCTTVKRESLAIDPLTLPARQEAHHTSDVNWIAVTNQR